MRRLFLAVVVLGCASVTLPAFVLAAQCGTERWEVKVGRDRDVSKINTTAKLTDVVTLVAIKPPVSPNKRGKSRWAPTELVVYEVEATIVLVKAEKDRDYHIVIKGKDGTTMRGRSETELRFVSIGCAKALTFRVAFSPRPGVVSRRNGCGNWRSVSQRAGLSL